MSEALPPITFFLHAREWPREFPKTADEPWRETAGALSGGVHAWTIRSYLFLKAHGVRCEIASTLPVSGIVLGHRRSLSSKLRPGPRQLLVCLKADGERHPFAQLHVVGNPSELRDLSGSTYIPHWPQPGLLPRDPLRGDRFETAAYFGLPDNLAAELREPSWVRDLRDLGVEWRMPGPERWSDYREIDAVIAIRGFGKGNFAVKPASKLYNAWHAGVPIIVGEESAYLAEQKSGLDFLVARSLPEARNAIARLRNDPQFRRDMIANGRIRAAESASPALLGRWLAFLEKVAAPAFHQWCGWSARRQKAWLATRALRREARAWKLRLRDLILRR